MKATILFGHGSRDPAWRQPIDNVALCMQKLDINVWVRCAFLELTQPDLATTVADLASNGVTDITIVPMFLGVGRHAREDLPVLVEGLQAVYPDTRFHLRPSVGEDAQVVELLARIAMPHP